MRLQRLATLALMLIGVSTTCHGAYVLVFWGRGTDFELRYNELHVMRESFNPYDLASLREKRPLRASEHARLESLRDSDLARFQPLRLDPAYPPWSYGLSTLVIYDAMPLRAARTIFAGLSLVALAITGACVWRLTEGSSTDDRRLLLAGCMAVFGIATTLRLGQYGLLLNALILGSHFGVDRKFRLGGFVSTILLALTALKPTIALPILAARFARGEWKLLPATLLVCAVGSLLPWALTGTDPIEMTRQMIARTPFVNRGGITPASVLGQHFESSVMNAATASFALATATLSGWVLRHRHPLWCTAIASIVGFFCLYHRQYDSTMLVPSLLAVGLLALRRRTLPLMVTYAACGLTLWVPLPYRAYNVPLIIVTAIVWLIAGIAIIKEEIFSCFGDPPVGGDSGC